MLCMHKSQIFFQNAIFISTELTSSMSIDFWLSKMLQHINHWWFCLYFVNFIFLKGKGKLYSDPYFERHGNGFYSLSPIWHTSNSLLLDNGFFDNNWLPSVISMITRLCLLTKTCVQKSYWHAPFEHKHFSKNHLC